MRYGFQMERRGACLVSAQMVWLETFWQVANKEEIRESMRRTFLALATATVDNHLAITGHWMWRSRPFPTGRAVEYFCFIDSNLAKESSDRQIKFMVIGNARLVLKIVLGDSVKQCLREHHDLVSLTVIDYGVKAFQRLFTRAVYHTSPASRDGFIHQQKGLPYGSTNQTMRCSGAAPAEARRLSGVRLGP
jgi:hypothetical protein